MKLEIEEYSWTKFEPEIDRRPARGVRPQALMIVQATGVIDSGASFITVSSPSASSTATVQVERRPPLQA